MNPRVLTGALLGLMPALLSLAPAAHAQFNTNLIANGNAESGTGSATGSDIETVPGFVTTGNFTVIQYGVGGGYPGFADPGPADRGNNLFVGGPNNPSSSAFQLISLTGAAAPIDAGAVTYDLAAYLGGYSSQNDNAVLTADFENTLGTSLGLATIGPVSAADRTNATGLLFRSATGAVPTGTRQVRVNLQMTRTDGAYDDGYADDLSLILKNNTVPGAPAVPESSSFALLALGLLPVGLIARRRKA